MAVSENDGGVDFELDWHTRIWPRIHGLDLYLDNKCYSRIPDFQHFLLINPKKIIT